MQIQAPGFFMLYSNVVVPKNLQIETIICWLCTPLLSLLSTPGLETSTLHLPDSFPSDFSERLPVGGTGGWKWSGRHHFALSSELYGVDSDSHGGPVTGGPGWHHFPLCFSNSREQWVPIAFNPVKPPYLPLYALPALPKPYKGFPGIIYFCLKYLRVVCFSDWTQKG